MQGKELIVSVDSTLDDKPQEIKTPIKQIKATANIVNENEVKRNSSNSRDLRGKNGLDVLVDALSYFEEIGEFQQPETKSEKKYNSLKEINKKRRLSGSFSKTPLEVSTFILSEKETTDSPRLYPLSPWESVWNFVLQHGRLPNTLETSALEVESFTPLYGPGEKRRKGRWTAKEETYAENLIEAYRQGKITLRYSTSLRKFLAECLNCDPMRVSKKFPCLKEYKIPSSSSRIIYHESLLQTNEPTHSDEAIDFFRPNGCPRRGRWTKEEERYAEEMATAFKAGQLPLPGGTSMRKFLAEVLNCDPMRVSKKFIGCVRKYHYYKIQAFPQRLQYDCGVNEEVVEKLKTLEEAFMDSITGKSATTLYAENESQDTQNYTDM